MRRLARTHLLAFLVALAVGAASGGLIYVASLLSGVSLYLVVGAVAGLVVAAVLRWFSNSAAISEVEVTVPQLSKITFAVTKDHKVMARRIVNQMASRVAIQPLDDGTGRADEAIASLYGLFTFVRDLLDEDASTRIFPGRPKVDVLAMNLLNRHLRPFLSTWHRAYEDWRAGHPAAPEAEWQADQGFRAALAGLQTELRPIAVAFATMAGYEGYLEIIGLRVVRGGVAA